ncbi:MAG: hypothetical protein ACO213_11070, partial [Steroidobacteraceae bacterium]
MARKRTAIIAIALGLLAFFVALGLLRQQLPPSSTNPIPVVYGDAWLGGTFVDAAMSTDSKTMYYVLAISSISANGAFSYDRNAFYYGDRLITFDGTDPTKVVSLTDGAG